MQFINYRFKKNYNETQLGSNEDKISRIKQYLKKLKMTYTRRETIIDYLSFQIEEDINCALYLDILSKSLNFIDTMELNDLLRVIKSVHDIYENVTDLNLNEFINLSQDEVIDRLYIGSEIKRSFVTEELEQYLNNLRFTAAINLSNKEYKNLFNSLSNNITYSAHYIFNLYKQLRKNLDLETLTFFDIYFANEYLIELHKININISEITSRRPSTNYNRKTNYRSYYVQKFEYLDELRPTLQLDLFTVDKIDNYTKFSNYYISTYDLFEIEGFQVSNLLDIENLPIEETKYGIKKIIENSKERFSLPASKKEEHAKEIITSI
jgi:hypothetical protein